MKYTLLVTIALFFMLGSFTSCEKNYSCECKFTDSTKNFTLDIEKAYKNEAKVVCAEYSTFVGNCAIK